MAWTLHGRSVLFAISIRLLASNRHNATTACNATALINVSEQTGPPSAGQITFASNVYKPTDSQTFYRTAYSEALRLSMEEAQWYIVTPKSITMGPTFKKPANCNKIDESASSPREASVCGKRVIDEIKNTILRFTRIETWHDDKMTMDDAQALAERAVYSCGQALPIELQLGSQLLDSHSSPEQQCWIYMKPGPTLGEVFVTSIIKSIWQPSGGTQKYQTCMRTNIEGKASEAYPATISFMKRTADWYMKRTTDKEIDVAFGTRAEYATTETMAEAKTIAESRYPDLSECYCDHRCNHFFGEQG